MADVYPLHKLGFCSRAMSRPQNQGSTFQWALMQRLSGVITKVHAADSAWDEV